MKDRERPQVGALFRLLAGNDVRYVVTGSVAVLLHGVRLDPGDLDITPALDRDNLARLARTLQAIEARPDPDGPFGEWLEESAGEWRWVERQPAAGEVEARRAWRADPGDPASFDELLRSRLGALDVVPRVSGTYDELAPRAVQIEAFGARLLVESIADLLATLTVPRREKDRDRVAALRALQRVDAGGARAVVPGGARPEPVIASAAMERANGRGSRPEGG